MCFLKKVPDGGVLQTHAHIKIHTDRQTQSTDKMKVKNSTECTRETERELYLVSKHTLLLTDGSDHLVHFL